MTTPTAADVEALAKWLFHKLPLTGFWPNADDQIKYRWRMLARALLTNPPAVLAARIKGKEGTDG